MKQLRTWAVLTMAFSFALIAPHRVTAATLIEDFDDFFPSDTYGSWRENVATLTSGPASFDVSSIGFGGGFFDISPPINADGETEIHLDVRIDAASSLPGVIVALVDGDGTEENYAWYALSDGPLLLTKPISMPSFQSAAGSIPGLDLRTLDFFHIQVDGGGNGGRYGVSFDNLELTIPEPACVFMVGAGLAWILPLRARRK